MPTLLYETERTYRSTRVGISYNSVAVSTTMSPRALASLALAACARWPRWRSPRALAAVDGQQQSA